MDFDSVSGLLFLKVTQHQTICSLHHCNPSFVGKIPFPLLQPFLPANLLLLLLLIEPVNLIQAFTFPLISDFSFHFRFFLSSSIFDSRQNQNRRRPEIGDGGGDDNPSSPISPSILDFSRKRFKKAVDVIFGDGVRHPTATNSSGIRLQPTRPASGCNQLVRHPASGIRLQPTRPASGCNQLVRHLATTIKLLNTLNIFCLNS
ncbi:hypothetical protein SLEP1_g27283 [Rubroshorea leprosula]|uniref:Uncharacterized protein n=1 Tax=Rubroshorea leprosula TaxID=152421 RepID=A0AAV5JX01_9ROSI|nr:hypothetical protein SLEP1_g27283 [Rubroshorea leprosula]